MIDILFKEHKSAKEVLEEEQDNKKLLEKYVVPVATKISQQKHLSNEWSKIKKEILKRMET